MDQLEVGEHKIHFDERKHVYRDDKSGLPVRGVTSVLKVLNKPALIQWSANMAASYVLENLPAENDLSMIEKICHEAKTAHRRFTKDAADIGTAVHKFAENTLRDGKAPTTPKDEKTANGCKAFLEWFQAHKIEPIHLEQMVFHPDWWYAGTADFYGKIDGGLCVLDFKTSSGLYIEHILQIAAYTAALERMFDTKIEGGWIVRLDKKTGKFSAHWIKRSDEDQLAFRHLLELDKHIKRLDNKLKELK